jgi:ABC-type phosphate transport system permease subunit
MVPMVMRTTEEIIKLVPPSLREAALALGYQRWRTTLQIVLLTALPGILTGALLAVARIAGETAPLLFTALGSQYLSTDIRQPMARSAVVYTYATALHMAPPPGTATASSSSSWSWSSASSPDSPPAAGSMASLSPCLRVC